MGRRKQKAAMREGKQLAIPRGLGTGAVARPVSTRRALNFAATMTGATGVIVATYGTSAVAISCIEWASYAGIFQEYRVRSIRLDVIPRFSAAAPLTGAVGHVSFVGSAYVGSTSVPSLGSTLSSQGRRLYQIGDKMTVLVSHESNPSADLWSATSGAPATLSLLGVIVQSSVAAPISLNGVVWDLYWQLDVEFRTAL